MNTTNTHNQILDLKNRMAKAIIGQEHVIEQLLIALLAMAMSSWKDCPAWRRRAPSKAGRQSGKRFRRIQFTPDLLPSDITGTEIYVGEAEGDKFQFQQGPVFGNLILADEINRAPAKAQSALLEAMEERQVTVSGKTYKLPELFWFSPRKTPLSRKARIRCRRLQMDRFLLHVFVGYSRSDDDERKILRLVRGEDAGLKDKEDGKLAEQIVFDARKEVLAVQVAEAVGNISSP